VKKAERFFGIENLSDPENITIADHINLAIKARGTMKAEIDYIVKDGEVLIVDAFTGSIMQGRRYSNGLHQAIEAKEGVSIRNESKTLATITFQNYFRLYTKLSGMTGTALTEEEEFREIYNLDVVEIPTNKPMIRIDHPDVMYVNEQKKFAAVIEQIKECHAKGQPVLVGTVSVEKSELLSKKLKLEGIPHNVLNAKYHEKEAEIVAQAGKLGAVTISTNMAGRGTDILLGGNAEFLAKSQMRREGYEEEMIMLATGSSQSVSEEVFAARAYFKELYNKYQSEIRPEAEKVCEAGGLFVIGTERHDARRIDNQLRGRSGRQGDPGQSRFYISLQDDLMRLFGGDRMYNMVNRVGGALGEDDPIDLKMLSDAIESAQRKVEDNNFQRRKNVLAYDDVMNQQRTIIYKQRQEVLEGGSLKNKMISMIEGTIGDSVDQFLHEEDMSLWDISALKAKYMGLLCKEEDFNDLGSDATKAREEVRKTLLERAMKIYEDKEQNVFGEETFREVERVVLLRNVDQKWMDHLEAMDSLMETIGLQAYAQRNPISEYRIVGADLFDEMVMMIRDDTVRMLLSVMPREQIKRVEVAKPVSAGFAGAGDGTLKKKPVVKKASEKIGRNDPCPCGSGKKYKKCCGANTNNEEN
ncbi:MAG: SEC-C domain-containing protein, partial [Clostridia bacterium]|nr:SEC-C domain-containing protein [Clostridia bacterium]